jgi:NADPH:quinone reductase-like Zn-dependent oxidoreductase
MAYGDMVAFIDAHAIKPPIGPTYALAEAQLAYQHAASDQLFGKAVIKISA